MTAGIRKAHDFLTGGAPHPLQMAGVAALNLPPAYYAELKAAYTRRRDVFLPYLRAAGLTVYEPEGAYYVMTDLGGLTQDDDVTFARRLILDPGVAAVPGSSFYKSAGKGRTKLRFCFCKRDETLADADRRLERLVPAGVRIH